MTRGLLGGLMSGGLISSRPMSGGRICGELMSCGLMSLRHWQDNVLPLYLLRTHFVQAIDPEKHDPVVQSSAATDPSL